MSKTVFVTGDVPTAAHFNNFPQLAVGINTADDPQLFTQTWNNAGVTFTGYKYNITDTASNAASLIVDYQVGGVSKFKGDRGGNLTATGAIRADSGFYLLSDVYLTRDAAYTLAQRNGTAANTFRVYNTYTDASNYERGVFDWTTTASMLTIGTQAAGTGSNRHLRLVGAGGYIFFSVSGSDYAVMSSASFSPGAHNVIDLGLTGTRFKNGFFQGTVTTGGYTVATLPTAGTAGRRAYVTDATAPTFLGSLTGGGAVVCPVFDNGSAWVSA